MPISLNFSTAMIFCWDPVESPFSESLSLFLLADKPSSAPADCLFSLRSAAPSLRTCQRKHSVETYKRERKFCKCERETERQRDREGWTRVGLVPVVLSPRWPSWVRSSSTLSCCIAMNSHRDAELKSFAEARDI